MVELISHFWGPIVCAFGALGVMAIYSKNFGGADLRPIADGDGVDLTQLLSDDED